MINNADLQAWLTLFPDDQQFLFGTEAFKVTQKPKPTVGSYPLAWKDTEVDVEIYYVIGPRELATEWSADHG